MGPENTGREELEQDADEGLSWKEAALEFLSSPPIASLLAVIEAKSGDYLKKITEELSKETWRFSKEEKQVKAALEKVINDNRSLLIQNMNSFRSFTLTLVGFSLTIIGFVASGLGKNSELPHAGLTKTGLLMLAGTVVVGVMNVLLIHVIENSQMIRLVRNQKSVLKEIVLALKEHHDGGGSFDGYLKQKIDILNASEEGQKKILGFRSAEDPIWPQYIMPVLASVTFCIGAGLVAISYLR